MSETSKITVRFEFDEEKIDELQHLAEQKEIDFTDLIEYELNECASQMGARATVIDWSIT
ncbi:MAG: hypothetical protein JW976_00105 [Syntrophaceae bacterium]|nr:hypothetical protein [Syntrophaceae bacterium]